MQTDIKEIDEKRQGEATMMPSPTGNQGRKLYLESYGCAMNFSDSEIIASIMIEKGFCTTDTAEDADVIFLNTCAIRDNAELRIWARLKDFRQKKKANPSLIVGVLGCMAERLKSKLLEEEQLVDLVVGPDAYRDLPNLLEQVDGGQKAVNVLLSREETYAGISPVRLGSNGISAFISITRGCNNMCSFCVVPFTRGRERSRDSQSIVLEAVDLFERGYKEVTLLGQNVDSYCFESDDGNTKVNFASLLKMVADVSPDLRVRFSTSHPKDITDEVLHIIANTPNICNYIHLPVQSGNSRVLELMNRTYTREWYLERVEAIRRIIPGCGLSTDVITGFCSETEEEHKDTLSIMEISNFDFSYMFKYSERPGTLAARKYADDIPEEIKAKRLDDIIATQKGLSYISNQRDLNKIHRVLIERDSKKSADQYCGRNDQNKMVVFPKSTHVPGDYVNVLVTDCTSATLKGVIVN